MFQSLLYWIMYYYMCLCMIVLLLCICFNPYCIGLCITTQLLHELEVSTTSFNPYCIGLCITTITDIIASKELAKFQSLLYWIMYYYNSPHIINFMYAVSFNPYCIGLCITTNSRISSGAGIKKFQSLLYWIMYYY